MTDLTDAIDRLDDPTAERIVRTVAKHLLARRLAVPLDSDAATAAALGHAAEVPPATPATAGDVARTALLLLAADAAHRPAVEQMVANPPPAEDQTRYADPA